MEEISSRILTGKLEGKRPLRVQCVYEIITLNWILKKYAGDSHYTRFQYPCFRTFAVSFQYHEEHQCPIRGQILKPITCVETSPGLSGNVMQMISLASKNSGASLTSKWLLLYVSCFTRFRFTRRFPGTQLSPIINNL
jgi:hypothetical protein